MTENRPNSSQPLVQHINFRIYIRKNILIIFFSQTIMRKCERMSTSNTGPTLKVNSAGKSICYGGLRDSQF